MVPSRACRQQRWTAPRSTAVDGDREFDLPLAGRLARLEGHDHGLVNIVGREVRIGQVKPRECKTGRTVEWGIAALAGAIARELPGDEPGVRHHDSGLAEGYSEVARRDECRAFSYSLPADVDLS